MSLLYAGGLWTVALLTAISAGYLWALSGRRLAYYILLGVAVVVTIGSQFLPEQHAFRQSILEGLIWWRWAITLAIPILLYAVLVRWLKRKANARHDA